MTSKVTSDVTTLLNVTFINVPGIDVDSSAFQCLVV